MTFFNFRYGTFTFCHFEGALRTCHPETPFALCHSEEAKRPKNLAQDKLRNEGSSSGLIPQPKNLTQRKFFPGVLKDSSLRSE
jgi:hypothetical protein